MSWKKTQEMTDDMKTGIALAQIDAYRHIKDMTDLGCTGTELSQYLAGLIRLEISRLPKAVIEYAKISENNTPTKNG